MPGFVHEYPVDVVHPPAVVAVVHHEPRPPNARIGEMPQRVLREEGAVGPTRVEPVPEVLHIAPDPAHARPKPQVRHGRVPPAALLLRAGKVGRARGYAERHDLDIVGPGEVRFGLLRSKPGQAVLNLGHHFGALLLAEFEVFARPLDDDQTDRHAADKKRAGGRGKQASGRRISFQILRRLVRELSVGAIRRWIVPVLAFQRPGRLGLLERPSLAQAHALIAEGAGEVQVLQEAIADLGRFQREFRLAQASPHALRAIFRDFKHHDPRSVTVQHTPPGVLQRPGGLRAQDIRPLRQHHDLLFEVQIACHHNLPLCR